ncbi:hypothetical protein Bca4012_010172 [Brassica carinata]
MKRQREQIKEGEVSLSVVVVRRSNDFFILVSGRSCGGDDGAVAVTTTSCGGPEGKLWG